MIICECTVLPIALQTLGRVQGRGRAQRGQEISCQLLWSSQPLGEPWGNLGRSILQAPNQSHASCGVRLGCSRVLSLVLKTS